MPELDVKIPSATINLSPEDDDKEKEKKNSIYVLTIKKNVQR